MPCSRLPMIFIALLLLGGCAAVETPDGPLDARAALIIRLTAPGDDTDQPSVETMRAQIRRSRFLQGCPPRLASIMDSTIPGPDGPIPVRVYRPRTDMTPGICVYYHGGGWVRGDLETHDILCRRLARDTPCIVVAVDYRRAPEHPFPAAVDDAWAALAWTSRHAADLGGDPDRLAVAGDSSGGNLAAVCAIRARDAGLPLAHQVLFYPVTDISAMDTDSYRAFDRGYMLERTTMEWFRDRYLPRPADRADPRVSPLRTPDLADLAPATIITAHFDPLRDEGEAYARRLEDAGVPVTLRRYGGMIHGFVSLAGILEQGRDALDLAADQLAAAFAPPAAPQ